MGARKSQVRHRDTVILLALCLVFMILMFYLGARSGKKYCDMEADNRAIAAGVAVGQKE
jgi:hypothetical protein